MLVTIPVADAMTETVQTVAPDESVAAVARSLRGADVGSLVVVDRGDPVGIVTESDLVGLLASGRDPDAVRVEEVMSRPLVTVESDQNVVRAAEIARDHGIEKLPVVDDGKLVGIVTVTDLLYYLPDLARRAGGPPGGPVGGDVPAGGLVGVRTDTAYEREDWEFVYDAESPDAADVGDVASFSKTLTDEDVRTFAEATGDTNRLHLDDEFAAETRFGRRIVHGSLVTGVISAALARLPGMVIYLAENFHFLAPVDVGDRVTAVCQVVEDLGRSKYLLSVTVRDEDENAVVTGSATVLIDPLPGTAAES